MSALEISTPDLQIGQSPEISTKRLTLRRLQLSDADRYAELLNNFAVAGNLARVPLPYSAQQAKTWLQQISQDTSPHDLRFAITTKQDGMIGSVAFHTNERGSNIGYWLGEPFWGQGYMTEAVTAAIRWFFDNTQAPALASGVFHFNMASLAIQHKLGFVEIGRGDIFCLARNRAMEHIDTELTREDFETSIL